MTAPTNQEQYLLELLNEARLNPVANAQRYIVSYNTTTATQANIQNAYDYFGVSGTSLQTALSNLTTVGALAWNSKLAVAAENHSAAMIGADEQSHQVAGEADLGARATAAGYSYSTLGENVYAYSLDALYAHAAFMVDWGYDTQDYSNGVVSPNFAFLGDGMMDPAGHRDNIMNGAFTEVGINVSYQEDASATTGPQVITQDLGGNGTLYVTGVAYTDKDGDEFYSYGEGRGDLTVKIGTQSVTSFASGGYNLVSGIGNQTISLSGGGLPGTVTVTTKIVDDNLKLDVVDGTTLLTSGSIVVEGNISEIRALGVHGLTIEAGSGGQTIYGTQDDDVLLGGAGNDTIIAGLGNDTIVGGAGVDIAVFEGNSIVYTVGTNAAGVTLLSAPASGKDTTEGVEIFRFSNGDHILVDGILTATGENSGNTDGYNVIQGTSRGETLQGTDAADLFIGGGGDDYIYGGANVDIASYAGNSNTYTVGVKGEVTVISGKESGLDRLEGVEIFRFVNGDFVMEDGLFVAYTGGDNLNMAPIVAASQNLYTKEQAGLTFTVFASDPEGETLRYTSLQGAHGTVSNSGNGKFLYQPDINFSGTDSVEITVRDGSGGISHQTVNIEVLSDPAANQAPQTLASQLGATVEGTPVDIKIEAFDPDGDELTFFASESANGDVTVGSGGVVTYTPDAGFVGGDSFEVTVSDTSGAVSNVTVTVLVEESDGPAANRAPVVKATQTIVLNAAGAATITVLATDPDGDALTYSVGSAAEGSITQGGTGIFTYTANANFDGEDSFVVTVNDGNGGTATQEISIVASLPGYKLLLDDDFAGTIGGSGALFGTNALQNITLLDSPGNVVLDGSFNAGGDVVRLPYVASDYTAYLVGTTAMLSDGDTFYSIPLGITGLPIVFADGARNLAIVEGTNSAKIGGQILSSIPTVINTPADETSLPAGIDPDANSLLSLEKTAEVTVSGDYAIFGTSEAEGISYLGGDVVLDPSFNLGADVLHLSQAASNYSAYVVGTSLVLVTPVGTITIPVGKTGMELDFNGDSRTLVIDTEAQAIIVGDQAISATSLQTAVQIGSGGTGNPGGDNQISLDGFPSATAKVFDLDDGVDFVLTDDLSSKTNAEIRNFDEGDVIVVTGLQSDTFSFTTLAADADGIGNDLQLNLSNGADIFTQILIKDVATPGQFVFDQATAESAVGYNFITFA